MIGYLRGQVLEHSTDGKMIVTLGGEGANAGAVGYQVNVPLSPAYIDFIPGKPVELFIYTHVREDAFDLYGFSSRAEKELFLTLLSVNGIGPKGALGILSKVSSAQLIEAVLAGDKDMLVQIPGIGKKTAERVVLELADPLRKKAEAGGSFGTAHLTGGATAGGRAIVSSAGKGSEKGALPTILRDAKEALIGLGYREQEITSLLNRVVQEKGTPQRVEDLIRTALQQLG